MFGSSLQLVCWKDVKDRVKSTNKPLFAAIDSIPRADDLPLVKAQYGFGEFIVSNDEPFLPISFRSVPYASQEIPGEIKKALDYGWVSFPASVVLKNSIETFVNLDNSPISLNFSTQGKTFSLYNVFDGVRMLKAMRGAYSTVAGSRSLFMLPKISHAEYNARLRRAYGVNKGLLCPKSLAKHWNLFTDIVRSPSFMNQWTSDLLIFSGELVNKLSEHHKHGFLQTMWNESAFSRNHASYNLLWSVYSMRLPSSVRNSPTIMETAKHLLALALGELPGCTPVVDDMPGPVRALTKTFLNIYRIRYYLPMFMQAAHYDGSGPIYYSLNKPSFFHPAVAKANSTRILTDVQILQEVLEGFCRAVLADDLQLPLKNSRLYQALQKVEFEFYHSQSEGKVINQISQIFAEDRRFYQMFKGIDIDKDLACPNSATFFNGCVRIRPAKQEIIKPKMDAFLSSMVKPRLADV